MYARNTHLNLLGCNINLRNTQLKLEYYELKCMELSKKKNNLIKCKKIHNLNKHSILKHKYMNKKKFYNFFWNFWFLVEYFCSHSSTVPLYRLTKHMKNQKLNYHLLEYKPFK